MPIIVCGSCSSSHDNGSETDMSIIVQKPYLRTNCSESKSEEDIDLKKQYRIKNSPDFLSSGETCSKIYVDNLFNDPSIIKTQHIWI